VLRKSNQPLQKMINCLMNFFILMQLLKKISMIRGNIDLNYNMIRLCSSQSDFIYKTIQGMHPWYLSSKEPSKCVHVKNLSVIFILNIFSNVRGDFIYGLRYRQTGNIYTYSVPSTSYYVRVGSLLNDSLQ
jgi:hypothetical protein